MLSGHAVIRQGDALHCDYGLQYLGLCTDSKQHAYCLLPGETDAPAGLTRILAAGQRVQELIAGAMAIGKSGNDVLRQALACAKAEGITAKIYAHPVGFMDMPPGRTSGSPTCRAGCRVPATTTSTIGLRTPLNSASLDPWLSGTIKL